MALFPEEFTAFLETIHSKPFLGGNAATLQQVVDGTAVYAMTDSDDVHAAIARGESVAMYYPLHHNENAGGTLLIPNTVAIVRGCARQEVAEDFIDFMLSDEVATLLASSPSHNIPLQRTVASQFPELQVEEPLQIDFYAAAALQEIAIKNLMESQFNVSQ
jgi:ABC-type Fe3+ transport system substrate-binding protein